MVSSQVREGEWISRAGRCALAFTGGLSFFCIVFWVLPVSAASQVGFPALRGHQVLRYQPPFALDDIEAVYLYGTLSFLESHVHLGQSPRPAPVFTVSVYPHDTLIPWFQQQPYPDIEVYLQAQFVNYTVWGLMENEVFDELDHIL